MGILKFAPMVICLSIIVNAHGKIYKCTDENGVKAFQDYPCANQTMTQDEIPATPSKNGKVKNYDNLIPYTHSKDNMFQGVKGSCRFGSDVISDETLIYAGGSYSGKKIDFQIDQSGHQTTQFEVIVNSPDKPVALILGAYEPSIWNIAWTQGTQISAVVATGYHRQVVAGLPKEIPILISSYDNRGPCGYMYVTKKNLRKVNSFSEKIFNKKVTSVHYAPKGSLVLGNQINPNDKLFTSKDTPPDVFFDKSAPLAGKAGLEDLIRQGLIRRATTKDFEKWGELKAKIHKEKMQPIASGSDHARFKPRNIHNGYVILDQITIPAGLYGSNSAIFFIEKGAPYPKGKLGHSTVYDFNTISRSDKNRVRALQNHLGAGQSMIQNGTLPKPLQTGKIKNEVSKESKILHKYSNQETGIPVNRFRAFYFDDRKPEELVYSQLVDRPALQHNSGKPVHGIPPKNLIVHWIGYIEVAQKTLNLINIFQANSANSEVLIDDTQIWSGKSYSRSLPYNFSKGKHKIEIRSKIRNHYFSVLVTMTENVKPLKKEQLSDALKPFSQADVMYCGVYESDNPDMTVSVGLKRKAPFVLFLTSYEPVVWKFMSQNITHLKAVIFSSNHNGSKMVNLPDNIPIYRYRDIPWAYSLIPDYNKKFKQTFKYAALEIQSILGQKPIGFTGAYKLKQANIPERIMDETQYHEIGLTLAPTDFDIEKLTNSVMDTVFEVSPAVTNETTARSWGANINSKNEIPRNAFNAFYFNINRPNSSIITETVEYAGIKYGSLENRPIHPKNFAGYWVGNWTFSESKLMQLNLSQSNATTRVYVDDKLIYQGGGNPNKGIEFSRGTHKIEVEHVNNWHTVDFLMSLQEKHPILPYEEIRADLKKRLPGDTKTIYVGVYESGKNAHSVTVNLKDSGAPTFLILNSDSPVKWVLKGQGKDRVKAILLSSQKSRSEVTKGFGKDLPVYHYRLLNAGFRLRPKCKDSHCEGKNFLEMSKDVEFLFQQKISGFTGKYSPDALYAPEIILGKAQYETLKNEMATLNHQQDEFWDPKNPDRDKILNQDHVKVAIQCMEYIQRYEYENFLALLSPECIERLGEHLKDGFTQLHNSVAGTSIQIDFRKARKGKIRFVFKRHGKKYGEIRIVMKKYQEEWKVKSI